VNIFHHPGLKEKLPIHILKKLPKMVIIFHHFFFSQFKCIYIWYFIIDIWQLLYSHKYPDVFSLHLLCLNLDTSQRMMPHQCLKLLLWTPCHHPGQTTPCKLSIYLLVSNATIFFTLNFAYSDPGILLMKSRHSLLKILVAKKLKDTNYFLVFATLYVYCSEKSE